MVEVIGMVTNKGALMGSAYTIFQEEKAVAFGLFYSLLQKYSLFVMDTYTYVSLSAVSVHLGGYVVNFCFLSPTRSGALQ